MASMIFDISLSAIVLSVARTVMVSRSPELLSQSRVLVRSGRGVRVTQARERRSHAQCARRPCRGQGGSDVLRRGSVEANPRSSQAHIGQELSSHSITWSNPVLSVLWICDEPLFDTALGGTSCQENSRAAILDLSRIESSRYPVNHCRVLIYLKRMSEIEPQFFKRKYYSSFEIKLYSMKQISNNINSLYQHLKRIYSWH